MPEEFFSKITWWDGIALNENTIFEWFAEKLIIKIQKKFHIE